MSAPRSTEVGSERSFTAPASASSGIPSMRGHTLEESFERAPVVHASVDRVAPPREEKLIYPPGGAWLRPSRMAGFLEADGWHARHAVAASSAAPAGFSVRGSMGRAADHRIPGWSATHTGRAGTAPIAADRPGEDRPGSGGCTPSTPGPSPGHQEDAARSVGVADDAAPRSLR